MRKLRLRETVQQAIGGEWPEFIVKHPSLARVIDEDLLVESAMEGLADDAEFRSTMEKARALGLGASAIEDVVARYVREWVARLA